MFSLEMFAQVIRDHPELAQEQDLARNTGMHFSQGGEDLIVSVFLNYVRPRPQRGVIVDFGAYHPYRFSNTFLMYLQGWHCLNIDGNAGAIELFKRLRPRDINLSTLVSDVEEELEYFKFPEGAYNTVKKESADFLLERGKRDPNSSSMEVERIRATPANVLLQSFVGNRQFDFLNIDLEGFDERVLRSIDYSRFRPRILAVEFSIDEVVKGPLAEFLSSIGYRLWSYCGNSAILIDAKDYERQS